MAKEFGHALGKINERSDRTVSAINVPKEKVQPNWTAISREHHSAETDRNVDH